MNRIVIIGNSGSGKSFLANQIREMSGIEVVHLDRLFWVSGGFNEKRPKETVNAEIDRLMLSNQWIVEGVFGELAERFLDRAECLVWLDLPWAICREGLTARGSESASLLDISKAEENFLNLLTWAENYWQRTNQCSHLGHQGIFDRFKRLKYRVKQREGVSAFLSQTVRATAGTNGSW